MVGHEVECDRDGVDSAADTPHVTRSNMRGAGSSVIAGHVCHGSIRRELDQ